MAKKNVIRPDASAVIVRILCWLAIIGGIGMIGYGVYTALEEQAAWIEGQQASYLHAHGTIPWRGGESAAPERNGTQFDISSSVSQHPETAALAVVETHVRWQIRGRQREETYRKLVAYHE